MTYIALLVINGLRGGHTHTDAQTKMISRNQTWVAEEKVHEVNYEHCISIKIHCYITPTNLIDRKFSLLLHMYTIYL